MLLGVSGGRSVCLDDDNDDAVDSDDMTGTDRFDSIGAVRRAAQEYSGCAVPATTRTAAVRSNVVVEEDCTGTLGHLLMSSEVTRVRDFGDPQDHRCTKAAIITWTILLDMRAATVQRPTQRPLSSCISLPASW